MNIYGLVSMLVCVGIPLGGAIYFIRRRDGTIVTFLVGALCFYISQPLIRIPLIGWLSKEVQWYYMLPYTSLVLYFILLGLSAGIFEECARWIAFRILGKRHATWQDGLAFGLGHGGIEAAWLFVTQVIPLIQNGQAGLNLLMGAWERAFTMLIHIGLTFVVLRSIRTKKIRWLLLAILLHGMVDFLIILQNVWILEGLVALEGIAALLFILKERKGRIFL